MSRYGSTGQDLTGSSVLVYRQLVSLLGQWDGQSDQVRKLHISG